MRGCHMEMESSPPIRSKHEFSPYAMSMASERLKRQILAHLCCELSAENMISWTGTIALEIRESKHFLILCCCL